MQRRSYSDFDHFGLFDSIETVSGYKTSLLQHAIYYTSKYNVKICQYIFWEQTAIEKM